MFTVVQSDVVENATVANVLQVSLYGWIVVLGEDFA